MPLQNQTDHPQKLPKRISRLQMLALMQYYMLYHGVLLQTFHIYIDCRGEDTRQTVVSRHII